jgi:opacity protein-like surface antigen
MKQIVFIICIIGLTLVVACPNDVQAQEGLNYMVLKGGAYFPTGDLEESFFGEFDTGFAGEIAVGHYFTRDYVFSPAIEIGVGYYTTDVNTIVPTTEAGVINVDGDGWAIPVRATLKAAALGQYGEFYTGVGFGVYFVNFDIDVSATGGTAVPPGTISDDDDDVVVGGHVMAGINFDITPNAFVGFEGQYIFTDEADIQVFEPFLVLAPVDLNGWTASATLGYRF